MRNGFWGRLVVRVVAYALAWQGFVVGLGQFSLSPNGDQAVPSFELCLHDVGDKTPAPTRTPDHSACALCIFCFAGSHHALASPPVALFHNARVQFVDVAWVQQDQTEPRLSAYSIAHPRGPPLSA